MHLIEQIFARLGGSPPLFHAAAANAVFIRRARARVRSSCKIVWFAACNQQEVIFNYTWLSNPTCKANNNTQFLIASSGWR